MYYSQLIILLLLSLTGFYLGSDIIGKSGRKILGQGFIVGIFSAIPELFVILTLLLSREYDLAISSAFTTALTIYSIGISVVSISAFIKWRTNEIVINNFQTYEKPIMLAIIGILISVFLMREINMLIGIFSIIVFIYYLLRKSYNVKITAKDLGFFALGIIILWFSSEGFVLSSSYLFPNWIFTIFFLPIALNIQDIILAIKGSLKSPELCSQMTLSFIVESIAINSFVFGIMGLLSLSGSYLPLTYPLLALLASNVVLILLFSHNNISIKESMILLSMYVLVPLSTAIHI